MGDRSEVGMGERVTVNGVDTYYEVHGEGEPLLLLHGGLCTNDTWGPMVPALAERFRVVAPERRGHGHTPDVAGPLSYEDMCGDTVAIADAVVGGPAHVVGWSDGGDVGLLMAIRRPDLVRRLVVMGANYDAAGVLPNELEASPDGDGVAMLRALYGAASPDGPEHWPAVFEKVTAMWSIGPGIGREELGAIRCPTLVIVGDDDAVSLEHTIDLYRSIPGAELAVVPGTSHALGLEKPELVNRIILDFLTLDPVETFIPIRRR
jgi:pimeloyl-ACP methyl ester carboxylesterase